MPADPAHPPASAGHAADDWDAHWSQYAEAAELNPAQGFRRRLILDALAIDRPAARVLDIGSGTGDMAADLLAALPDPEVVGLELSATGVEISRRKVPRATFIECDLLAAPRLPEYDGWAEYAVCSEVLEHVDEPAALLAAARPSMAPGCRLVVTVPGGPMSAFDRHIGHRTHFDRESLATVMREAGLEPVDVRAAGFPFFNLYRLTVIAAGRRVISGGTEGPSGPMRVVGGAFDALMRRNTRGRRLGFQIVGVARNPGAGS